MQPFGQRPCIFGREAAEAQRINVSEVGRAPDPFSAPEDMRLFDTSLAEPSGARPAGCPCVCWMYALLLEVGPFLKRRCILLPFFTGNKSVALCCMQINRHYATLPL